MSELTPEEVADEIWKDVTVEDYSELYEISNVGRFRNKATGNVLAACKTGKYMLAKLHNKGALNRYMVHRLVACAFVEDPEDDEKNDTVNHIDGNKMNNRASNLEWTTASKNAIHSREVLGQKKTFKTVICTDINGEEFIYEGVKNASIATGIKHTRLKNCLSGKISDTDGLTWRYQDERHNRTDVDTNDMTPIKDFPGYFIDEHGKVYGITKHQFLTYNMSEEYPKIMLYKKSKAYCFYVHVLVAKTFIPNPDNLRVVNHIDSDKSNCHVSNLEWVSHSENNNKYIQMKRNLSVRNAQSRDGHGDGENSSVTV